jgi:hypothetical protein
MWKELLKIAPELIPLIIQTVLDVENVVSGIRNGEIKKSRVMSIIGSVLETKDYFLGRDSDGKNLVLNLVSMFIDVTVSTFNYTGLFASKDTLDFSPIPITEEVQDEGN